MRSPGRQGIGVLVVVVTLQMGCAAVVVPPPLPAEVRAGMGAVGVAGAADAPDREIARPIPSKPLAALAGLGGGLGVGVLAGAGCFVTMGYGWPFCAVAAWTPVMMATGVAEGVDKGVTWEAVKAGSHALEDAMGADRVQDALRDAVVQAATGRPGARAVVSLAAGAPPPVQPEGPARPAAEGVDTVLEVRVVTVGLRRARPAGPSTLYGPGLSFEGWMNPALELIVEARVRLIRARDGAVLWDRGFSHTRGRDGFVEWTRDDARAFREARDAALQSLGAEIAEQVFS